MDFERAFVTGATGLLGSTLVRKLVARGVQVTALARSIDRAHKVLRGLPVNIVEGDLGNIPTFSRSLAGNEVLFHAAACYRRGQGGCNDWEELYKTNVEGSEYLYKHAWDAGIRRFVHVSSTIVLQNTPFARIDETMLRGGDVSDDYVRSRILSDQVFMNFLQLHPEARGALLMAGCMLGPRDAGPSLPGQVLLDFLGGRLAGVLPAWLPLVDVRDVAVATIQAARRGRPGQRYVVAGRTLSMAELFARTAQAAGQPPPPARVPMPLLLALTMVNEAARRLSGRPLNVGLSRLCELARESGRCHYVSLRAEHELGVEFRPLQDTLADVVRWFREHGCLPSVLLPGADSIPSGASRPS